MQFKPSLPTKTDDRTVGYLLITLYTLVGEVCALNRQVSCETNPPKIRQAAKDTIEMCRELRHETFALYAGWDALTAEQRNERSMAVMEVANRILAEL